MWEITNRANNFARGVYDYESAEYRVTAIILDTARYRLFRLVRSDRHPLSTDAKTHFIKRDFINKIYHFCVKLLTSMHCNGLNGK